MRRIDASTIDLNLLVVLRELVLERSVTRAGRRLHLTQSATSHALARLRVVLGDPLLVRSGREMKLTPRAEALATDLPRLFRSIERVLAAEAGFDPATSERVFLLGAPDFASVMLPGVVERLARRVPRAGLEFLVTDEGVERELMEGRLDLALASPLPGRADGVLSEELPRVSWAVFVRKGHPAAHGWCRGAWEQWPHVLVRRGRETVGPVQRRLLERGLRRRVGAYVPQFVHAAPLLAATDMMLLSPLVAMAPLAPRFGLVALEAPVDLAPVLPRMHTRAELAHDPALGALREVVRGAFTELVADAERAAVVRLRDGGRKARAPRAR